MIADVNRWLAEKVEQYEAKSLYLPAGNTPKKLYAEWRRSPHQALAQLALYQVDDVAEGERRGAFAQFFSEELPQYKVHEPKSDVQADLGILGLGVNGHVAFHEPGIPETFRFGEVILRSETTVRLGVKAGTKAVTYGLGAFLETKALLLMVVGKDKKRTYERFLAGDSALPATALYKHPDLTLFVDL